MLGRLTVINETTMSQVSDDDKVSEPGMLATGHGSTGKRHSPRTTRAGSVMPATTRQSGALADQGGLRLAALEAALRVLAWKTSGCGFKIPLIIRCRRRVIRSENLVARHAVIFQVLYCTFRVREVYCDEGIA